MSKNKFFCVEGVDGTGKSTFAKLIAERLGGVIYHSPPQSMKEARPYIRNSNTALQFLYYTMGNAVSAREIGGLLEESNVIADRYVFSTTAAFSTADRKLEVPNILMPDAVIYVQAPWEDVDRRLNSRGERGAWERLDFLKEKDAEYERLFSDMSNVVWVWNPDGNVVERADRLVDLLRQDF